MSNFTNSIESWAQDCDFILSTEFDFDHQFTSQESLDTISRFESLLSVSQSIDLPADFAEQLFCRLTGNEIFETILADMILEAIEYQEEYA